MQFDAVVCAPALIPYHGVLTIARALLKVLVFPRAFPDETVVSLSAKDAYMTAHNCAPSLYHVAWGFSVDSMTVVVTQRFDRRCVAQLFQRLNNDLDDLDCHRASVDSLCELEDKQLPCEECLRVFHDREPVLVVSSSGAECRRTVRGMSSAEVRLFASVLAVLIKGGYDVGIQSRGIAFMVSYYVCLLSGAPVA
jgi:hypothetical protein